MDSPDLAIAMRLLDSAKAAGFTARRVGRGEDAPLLLTRTRGEFSDEVLIDGFSRDCYAVRHRHTRLIRTGAAATVFEVSGGALHVLNTVLTWP